MMYAPQLQSSIVDYKLVEMLVYAAYDDRLIPKKSILNCLDGETLRLIVEYAFPGLGPLVPLFIELKNINFSLQTRMKQNYGESSYFRICVRKRPLFLYELQLGMCPVRPIVHYIIDLCLHYQDITTLVQLTLIVRLPYTRESLPVLADSCL